MSLTEAKGLCLSCLIGSFGGIIAYSVFSFAFLLIIFCSVERAEFGWSMLVCALMPTAYGIILGLLALIDVLDGEGGAKALLVLFVIGGCIYGFRQLQTKI